MQQFKSFAKNAICFLKNAFRVFYIGLKAFCKKVTSFVLHNIVGFFKRSPRALAAVVAAVIIFTCTATVVLAIGATTAYSVVYNGQTIATVKDSTVLAEAEIFAANQLNNPECISHLIKTNLTQTIAVEKNLMSSKELAKALIDNSKDIVTANVLKVEGNVVATGESNSEINNSIKSYLSDYKNKNGIENIEISNDFQVTKVYTLNTVAASLPLVENYLSSDDNTLSLQTVSYVVVKEKIPFETIKTESSTLACGAKKITQNGVNGIKEITYKVYSLNGVETERIIENEKTISEPIDQKVTVGTKKVVTANTQNGNYSMCWPVKRVEKSFVSSYMGDGRGHKGMDIVAPAGTPIYAAEDGTVTFSGWDSSGYGYKIIVKHSNGYETLYAHSSALYVKKGDVVVKGQNIAAVGTTGRSTGNHLHFEVRHNGSIKNPANYIGRN